MLIRLRPSRRIQWLFIFLLVCLGSNALRAEPSILVSGTNAGTGRSASGHWSLLTLTVSNTDAQARMFNGVVTADAAPATQYAIELWVPPQSKLVRTLPFYVDHIDPSSRSLEVTALLAPQDQPNLSLSRQPALLIADHNQSRTALVGDPTNDTPIQIAQAVRKFMGLDDRIMFMRPESLPTISSAYGMLDHVVLARPDLKLDAAQLAALRQWLVQGGRLWIMADTVPLELLESLLTEQIAPQRTGRSELHQISIEYPEGKTDFTTERPVTLVRLSAPPQWDVLNSVQGWPTAMQCQVGQGKLLVTALGPRAWVDDKGVLRPVTESLSKIYFQKRNVSTREHVQWDQFLLEQIGYRVISRGIVMSVLGAYLVAFLMTGLWLHRKGRMEQMGWIGAILALVGGSVLLLLGVVHRQDTPSTFVAGAMVELHPQQRLATSKGWMQIYNRRQDDAAIINGVSGGEMLPMAIDRRGGRKVGGGRMLWTDLDRWQWERLSFPENAVASMVFANSMMTTEETGAELVFDTQGLKLLPRGLWLDGLQDAVLVGPSGNLAPISGENGTLLATGAQALTPGQFVTGVLSGQQQQLRQQIYRSLFELSSTPAQTGARPGQGGGIISVWKPTEPLLMGWTDGIPAGISLSMEARKVSWSLVSVPLTIRRPEPGTSYVVPSALVKFEVRRETGSPRPADQRPRPARSGRLTTAYDEARGQWLSINQGGTVPVRFTIPQALLPATIESARLMLDIRAAGRSLDIQFQQGENAVSIYKQENVLGLVEVEIPSAQMRDIKQDGSVLILLSLSEHNNPEAVGQPWNIVNLGLEVSATSSK